ncbi:MAG: hypothetical protein ACE5E6_07840 [Phycisphaerae bacterium]
MNDDAIIGDVRQSTCFQAESACLARSDWHVADRPRLFKRLENDKVRLIFPTDVRHIDLGVAVGLVCLFDLTDRVNVYAHTIFAGPDVNPSLKSLFVPKTQAKPQPGIAGHEAVVKFAAWKRAAWIKFLNDELDLGTPRASAMWIDNFWKALDRMYGGGNLIGGGITS